jgi:predicted ATPase
MATAPATTVANELLDHTLPPFLRRVRIRAYKSIGFCDVHVHPLTILVGRNAAGKSNFLDALAFLRDALSTGVPEAVKRRGGWHAVASRTTDQTAIEIDIEAGFSCGRPVQQLQVNESGDPALANPSSLPSLEGHAFSARYSLQVVGGHNSPPVIRREWLDVTDKTTNEKGGFDVQRPVSQAPAAKSDKKEGAIVLGGGATVLHWKAGNAWSTAFRQALSTLSPQRSDLPLLAVLGFQPFLELSEGLRFMGFYNFHPDAIRAYQKPNPGWLLEKDGRNLASVIEGLKESDPEAVRRVRDYLTLIAEEVTSFDVERYGDNETVRFGLRQEADKATLEFDATSISDGTLRALAALMAAYQIVLPRGYPAVVGIEEPETALHPAAMRALVDALDDATQRTQILLTTHSADLLSGRDVNPGQVLVVRNRGGKTLITPLDPASREIVAKELYSLADLQRMDRLDLDEADLRRQTQLGQEGA